MVTQLARWGNSLGVRIPKVFADELGLRDGEPVEIKVEAGRIVLAPSAPRYRLADLVADITPKNRHEEVDDGPSVGKETW